MRIKQYDQIVLKDGRTGCVVEVLSEDCYLVDVGSSPKDWDTIDVTRDQIEKVVK